MNTPYAQETTGSPRADEFAGMVFVIDTIDYNDMNVVRAPEVLVTSPSQSLVEATSSNRNQVLNIRRGHKDNQRYSSVVFGKQHPSDTRKTSPAQCTVRWNVTANLTLRLRCQNTLDSVCVEPSCGTW
jgi:hypothetical protein